MFDLLFKPEILLQLLDWIGPKMNTYSGICLVRQNVLACRNSRGASWRGRGVLGGWKREPTVCVGYSRGRTRKSVTKSYVICAGKNTQIAQESTSGEVQDPRQPCVQLHISGVITAHSLSLSFLTFAPCLLFLSVRDVLTFSQRRDHFVCAIDPRAPQRSGALSLPHGRKCACNCSCVSSSTASPAQIRNAGGP